MSIAVDKTTGEFTETSPTPYQLLPRLTDEEYDALKADIAENGIRVPIDVDEFGVILDGHHRAWIAADLHITCPQRRVEGLSDEAKRAHAIAVNIHRRNLTGEQRRELILRLRSEGMSTRAIAESVGVGKDTVARAVQSVPPVADETGHTTEPPAIVGQDGKNYQPETLEQRRELAATLKAEGYSISQIADVMKVAKSTAQSLLTPRRPVSAEPDVTGRTNADKAARVDKIRELASSGHSSQQIAAIVDRTPEIVRTIARENSIEIGADKIVGRRPRIDSNEVMQSIVDDLEQLDLPMRSINFTDLDAARATEWANSLTESIRALNRFVKQIKELTQQ